MDKRVNSSSTVTMNKQQAMKKLRAVDIVSAIRIINSSFFITVHIDGCSAIGESIGEKQNIIGDNIGEEPMKSITMLL